MNFRLSKKRDIVLDMVEKKNKPKKQKAIKMSDIFQTNNSKIIYKPKNTITQVLNDTQKIQMDKLIRKHKER